jgi:hypothetical protein
LSGTNVSARFPAIGFLVSFVSDVHPTARHLRRQLKAVRRIDRRARPPSLARLLLAGAARPR